MKSNLVKIGTIIFVAIEENDGSRLIRTVVKLTKENYNVYEKKLYILKDGREYEFKQISSSYSGLDRSIAPLIFIESEYFPFDYIGCDIYTKFASV